MPKYEPVKSNLVGTAFIEGQTLFISIADGESETVFSTNLPRIEISDFELIVNVSTNYISSDTIATTVSVNGVSDSTFLQAAIVKKNCSMSEMCQSLTEVLTRLDAIENAINNIGLPVNSSVPTTAQQSFFFLQ